MMNAGGRRRRPLIWTARSAQVLPGNSCDVTRITATITTTCVAMWRVEPPSRWRRPWCWPSAGGYPFPCDPQQSSDRALTLWDVNVLAAATVLTTAPPGTESVLRFDSLPSPIFSVDRDDGRHMLWRETYDERRVWILPDASPMAPVAAVVPFDKHLPQRLEAILRLWQHLTGIATRPAVSPLTGQQRHRMILMLRALDGREQHATYRDLAATLLDPDVRLQSRGDWLTSSHRAQIVRLVKDGTRRMNGGYRDLLRG